MTNKLYYLLAAEKRFSIKVSECGATPLVDATARFLKGFMVELPLTEWQSQPATGRISRANGEKEDGDISDGKVQFSPVLGLFLPNPKLD